MPFQTQLDIEKAIADNPDVFEYDNIYDDMQEKRKSSLPGAKKEKEKKVLLCLYLLCNCLVTVVYEKNYTSMFILDYMCSILTKESIIIDL